MSAREPDPSEQRPGELLPRVYEELRGLARARFSSLGRSPTLQTTALVHEAWMRLDQGRAIGEECRAHFYGAAANAMRNVLVEQARRKARLKRGGHWRRVPITETSPQPSGVAPEELLALDEALERFAEENPRMAEIVRLRYFTGLSIAEVARALGIPESRVEREWRFARSWLQREIDGGCRPDAAPR